MDSEKESGNEVEQGDPNTERFEGEEKTEMGEKSVDELLEGL